MDKNQRIANALKMATDTKVFELGEKILDRAPKIFNELFPERKAVIFADDNTWKAAGEEVYNYMKGANIPCESFIIHEQEFHAEWKYIEMVDEVLTNTGAIAVSVGSGVINDLCKLCSHHHNQSYLSIATAASVDGYSSFGASIVYQNAKQTFDCPAPVALLADVNVIAAAPKEMTAAGYADLAAKIPAGAEWMIADLMQTEPIIPNAWHVLQDVLDDMLSDPKGVAEGKPEAISSLFEGLTLSGFAMQAARSSRPASCTDHLFNHIWDMTHHRYHGKLQSHGFQVAIGTLTMCAFFDEFFKMDLTKIDVDACVNAWPSLEEEQQRALKLFKDFPAPKLGYTEITKKYNDKETVRKQLTLVKDNWVEFKKKLQKQCYTFDKMQHLFAVVGAPTDPSQIGITREYLKSNVDFAQMMRWRFNLLDLAKRARIYDELVNRVFGKGGAWEI
jgi:glycerol-1-phosphate dehydrogenase [NAD(P)+]